MCRLHPSPDRPAGAYHAIMRTDSTKRRQIVAAVCAVVLWGATLPRLGSQELPDGAHLQPLRDYIKKSWSTLSRSNRDLLQALPDPKMPRPPGEPLLLYISREESRTRVQEELARDLGADALKQIEIRELPRNVLSIREHGLLYLPYPYVVPGGRFNEMYGWDSYFIQVGLLHDGQIARGRDMVANFL